ncbi:MAG: FAD-dependent oxidoreductase [Planctomycetota bacterium]
MNSCAAEPAGPLVIDEYEVVIAGGTTAALAAAIASAEKGAKTALLEPTDWIGGQLTASGVPAVDEAWHSITDKTTGKVLLDVSTLARKPKNMTPKFRDMLLETGCPGGCWVSRFCFEPKPVLDEHLLPATAAVASRLTVYPNTVVKSLTTDESTKRVTGLVAIRRFPRTGVKWQGYDRPPSADIVDWYSAEPSERFEKRTLRFDGSRAGKRFVVIEATEWGEVLALCGARYLVGVDEFDGAVKGDDTYGQATVYGVVQEYSEEPKIEPVPDLGVDRLGFGPYTERDDAWEKIWTYRRLRGSGDKPQPGDLSLQNWGYSSETNDGGNDYPFEYLFKTKAATDEEADDWHGGVDLGVLEASEKRALAWHYWLKANTPEGIEPEQITLSIGTLGTGHGLSKLPYIRDTRRSIGLDGFVLRFADLSGSASQRTGTKFADRIAIGAYPGGRPPDGRP